MTKKHGYLCFSQSGEDAILNSNCSKSGFYIDVGANHPFRFSNTCLLHKRGWTGINIDPNPGTKQLFDKYRPSDINLEIAIGKSKKPLPYYIFEESCLNTFCSKIAKSLCKKKVSGLLGVQVIKQVASSEICKKYLQADQKIGLLNIDAEGKDAEILESHDWHSFPPDYVIVERFHGNLRGRTGALQLLRRQGYAQIAQTCFSVIFRKA